MANAAPLLLETFLSLWSLGALTTVVVTDGVAVPVTVGEVGAGELETVGEGCAVEAAGRGVAGAGAAAAGRDGVDDGAEGAGDAGGDGVGDAAGPFTIRTGV